MEKIAKRIPIYPSPSVPNVVSYITIAQVSVSLATVTHHHVLRGLKKSIDLSWFWRLGV